MDMIIPSCKMEPYLLTDNGTFPNNEHLPVLIYKQAVHIPLFLAPLKSILKKNGWFNFWKAGVFTYHHYHSNTHELLVVYKGKATLLFGGTNGVCAEVEKGDVVLIPAGVAHKNMNSENDLQCLGAYPNGREYDMNYGKKGERPRADETIKTVPVPEYDPLYGSSGPMKNYWK